MTEHDRPEPPPPDRKDWTWVLRERCPQCGVAAYEYSLAEVADLTERAGRDWVDLLATDDAAHLRTRPRPRTWSPTEYAAHVRDVARVFRTRLDLMLAEATPSFPDWDQDAAAIAGDYAAEAPAEVATALVAAVGAFAARVREVGPEQEGRRGVRSNGSEFTVLTLCQYFLHDVLHHLHDVGRPLGPGSRAG